MYTFSANVVFDKTTNGQTDIKHLSESVTFEDPFSNAPTLATIEFGNDIKISVYHMSCFIYVCPFVALSKAKFAENVHSVLCSPY